MVPQPASSEHLAALARDPEALARANIHPVTRLATDYLNHYNEIVMLLEMLESCPEFVSDILGWRPKSYVEYFERSTFKDRALALVAFEMVDPAVRTSLEEVTLLLTEILDAILDALRRDLSPESAARLGTEAVGWLKPLIARANGVINGEEPPPLEVTARQSMVDELFAHAG